MTIGPNGSGMWCVYSDAPCQELVGISTNKSDAERYVGLIKKREAMKTIRETVKENEPFTKNIIAALESREKERDESERERVLGVVCNNLSYLVVKDMNQISVIDYIRNKLYPPPGHEKLPAGYYWMRATEGIDWVGRNIRHEFIPPPGYEYRRGDDPPPEVTGKQVALKSVCCNRYADNMACDCPKEKS